VTGWSWANLDEVTPPETAVHICLRGDLVAEKDLAVAELVRLRDAPVGTSVDDPNAAAQQEIALRVRQLEAECLDASVLFRFKGLGRKQRSDLEAAHPPTDGQKAEAEAKDQVALLNGETYKPALVAASCYEPPGITLVHATRMFNEWTDGQWEPLFRACATAQYGAADPGPKSSIASAVLRDSEPS
jgi:hypothetical protein